jgi:hypothetical protein
MLNVAIIIGSTRPGRKAEDVARWVYGIAAKRSDASFELVDIAAFNLPLLDEALPPSMGQYAQPHTKAWAAKIATFDAFVFVTPEYNHSAAPDAAGAEPRFVPHWAWARQRRAKADPGMRPISGSQVRALVRPPECIEMDSINLNAA